MISSGVTMTAAAATTIMTALQLAALKAHDDVIIIDMSSRDSYQQAHIPQAIWCDYNQIVAAKSPVMGLLPAAEVLAAALELAGIRPHHHVVVYDNEDGLKAARMLWTLDAVGHASSSFLEGGLATWRGAGFVTSSKVEVLPPTHYPVTYDNRVIAERDFIYSRLHEPGLRLIDARSADEYSGRDVRSSRGGHIPGAVNIEWSRALNPENRPTLRSAESLKMLYESANIWPQHEIILYCQTHRRSAHSYVVLKSLGYTNIKGYPGSWSDWGNQLTTPVETGTGRVTIST